MEKFFFSFLDIAPYIIPVLLIVSVVYRLIIANKTSISIGAQPRKKNWGKIILYGVIGFILAKLIFGGIGEYYGRLEGEKLAKYDIEKKKYDDSIRYYTNTLPLVAAELNKTYPKAVDADLRIDSVSVIARDSTISYNFTLINISKAELDVEKAKDTLFKTLSERAVGNPGFDDFRKHKVKVYYTYYDKNNQFLFKLNIPLSK